MIKRSTGFFKIAFFVFCLFIALFLISFSLTDIRNYVTAEMCIFSFCVSITIIPLVLEWIIYAIGILTKGIRINSREEVIGYKSMKNSQVPYTRINDNGVEKMMFFCDKGRIILLSSANTEIHWGCEKDEIRMKTQFGECYALFKGLYGTKYDNVECEVFTMLPEINAVKEDRVSAKTEMATAGTNPLVEQPTVEPVLSSQSSDGMNVPLQPSISNPQPVALETNEEFDYALKETDTLLEETINI